MLASLAQDFRYGVRQLIKAPTFTLVAVASLALGIGANTAIFQLIDAIRLRVLPVQKPRELVTIDFTKGSARAGWWSSRSARFTSFHWDQLRSQQKAFTDIAAWSAARFDLTLGGPARFAEGMYVSDNFFRLLGVPAASGRVFSDRDDSRECTSPGVVLGYAFWQREFGGEPHVTGRTIHLDGHPLPIIGVTPASFFGVEVGDRFDVAIPLCADRLLAEDHQGRSANRAAWWLSIMGRLKPDWTAERATAHLQALSPGIMRATLPTGYKADLAKRYLADKLEAEDSGTGVSGIRREYEQPLWVLMATAGLVLVIACANLANLLLARASVREREIAVRLAVGASRWRLIRQLLAESLLLAGTGAILGSVLAQVLVRGLVSFISRADNPLFISLSLDWTVFSFTGALAILTCLLFGLMPAIRATHQSPASAIHSGSRSVTAGRERFSLRRALVATQIALSLVLLVSALLFVRSLHNLLTNDSGYQPDGIVTISLDFTRAQFPKDRRFLIYRELREALAALPGVTSTGQVMMTPVSGSGWDNSIGPDNTPAASSGKDAWFNRVGPNYFHTMGTGLIAGRDFTESDRIGAPNVAIVNEEFTRKYFKGANPIGHSFHLEAEAGKPEKSFQIIGLTRNSKYYELREDFRAVGFFPIAQDEDPGAGTNFVLRVAGSPGPLLNGVKEHVAAVSPAISIAMRSFSTQLADSLLRERLMAMLSGGFGLLAGLLATLGLYGVIAYMVARRRNEIGVRIALGADRARVVGLVLREAMILLSAGVVVGTLLSLWVGRAASTLLFGLKPYDPASLFGAIALLAVIALAASYIPARRAAALDPMVALRQE